MVFYYWNRCVCDTGVLLSYLLQGAFGKPSACEPGSQLSDVDVSIFVDVQLIKQLSPALLPVQVRTIGFTVLAARPRDPLGSHNWCQSESADGIQEQQFNHRSLTHDAKASNTSLHTTATSKDFQQDSIRSIIDPILTCNLCLVRTVVPNLGVTDPTTGHKVVLRVIERQLNWFIFATPWHCQSHNGQLFRLMRQNQSYHLFYSKDSSAWSKHGIYITHNATQVSSRDKEQAGVDKDYYSCYNPITLGIQATFSPQKISTHSQQAVVLNHNEQKNILICGRRLSV